MLHACEAADVIQHRRHDQLCFQEFQRRHDEKMLETHSGRKKHWVRRQTEMHREYWPANKTHR